MKRLSLLLIMCIAVLTAAAKEYINIDDGWLFYNGAVDNGQSVTLNTAGATAGIAGRPWFLSRPTANACI